MNCSLAVVAKCSTTNSTPTNSDHTSNDINLSSSNIIVLIVINTLCCVAGTIGNALVLVTLTMNKYLHTVPDFFLFSLALADLLVTLIQNPILVFKLYEKTVVSSYDVSNDFNIVTEAARNFSLLASVSSMFLITLDRFLAIQMPFKYSAVATKEIAVYVIGLAWGACLAMITGHVFMTGADKHFFISGFITSLLLFIIIMYISLYVETKRHDNKIRRIIVPETNACCRRDAKSLNYSRQKHDSKAIRTIAVVVGFFLASWVPYLVFTLACAHLSSTADFQNVFHWVYTLCLCNSTVNPYVYCARTTRYRKAFIKLIKMKNNRVVGISKSASVIPVRARRVSIGAIGSRFQTC